MGHIQRPLTLPKHPELLRRLNEMSICIKLNYIAKDDLMQKNPESWMRTLAEHKAPSWQNVVELLAEARAAIDEQREYPRKY